MSKNKWGESYAHKAAVFASTAHWHEEALETMFYRPVQCRTVLDVGCNMGAWEQLFRDEGETAKVYAMDVNEYAIDRLNKENIPNVSGITDLDVIPEGIVDFVVMMHVINQIEDFEGVMAKVWRKMRSGGVIVVVTHNPIPSKFRWLENKIKGYKPDSTMVREPLLGELRHLMYFSGFIDTNSYYFGKKLVPFLNRRLVYVGTKP
ncbi:MAG: class I SAM-dependent methyltransferase [Bacteroidaceae bacterium]